LHSPQAKGCRANSISLPNPLERAQTIHLAVKADLAGTRIIVIDGFGYYPGADERALFESPATLRALYPLDAQVDLDWLVENLGLVQQGLHGADPHEGAVFGDLGDRAVNDFVALHREDQGLEADVLVNGAITVDDLTPANGLVIEGQQSELFILVEAAFECVVGELIDVVLQSAPPPDVLCRDADGILSCLKGVHSNSFHNGPSRSRTEVGVASRPSSAMPLEERSVRPGDRPTLYKRNGAETVPAISGCCQTVGLNESLVRMFKWTRNRISQSDGSGCIAQGLSRQASVFCRCHTPVGHDAGAGAESV